MWRGGRFLLRGWWVGVSNGGLRWVDGGGPAGGGEGCVREFPVLLVGNGGCDVVAHQGSESWVVGYDLR